ncbi:hypothetical protein NC653_036379 [Populus alba x Populus x berolinensis]|uniref:Uncharacterized protein n=1 Tax=Populus alba x Populus x berolinensis TaxID=444605 RepID=A0AAD6PWD0_9ROSI|nr:hypothetical protein NC653_036379 [Populus alba x Populus x berolinensis]
MYKSVTWLQEFLSGNTLMPQLFLGVTGGGDLFSRLVDGVQYNAVIKWCSKEKLIASKTDNLINKVSRL